MARTGRPETPLRWRFLTKFDFNPDSGCWVWTGARHSQGYGLIKRKAHNSVRIGWPTSWCTGRSRMGCKSVTAATTEDASGRDICFSEPPATTQPTWSPKGVQRGSQANETAQPD